MANNQQATAVASDKGEQREAYAPAWTADPWVCVSKRTRILEFPAALLTREATASEKDAWRKALRKDEDVAAPEMAAPRMASFSMTLSAGVTILGALTTQWRLLGVHDRQHRPRTAPVADECVLVWPVSDANNQINNDSAFKGRDAQGHPIHDLVDPARVSDAWRRVLAYLKSQEDATLAAGVWLPAPLFNAQRGFDAPELTVGRLSDFLNSTGDAAREAYPFLTANIKGCRDGRHLGAFHDYCVRHDRGWNFAEECRSVLRTRPGLAPR